MKKITLILLTFAVVISSCNNFSADIAKRKYRKGYSVSISFKKKAEQQPAAVQSEKSNDTATAQTPALVSYPFLNSENQSQLTPSDTTGEKSQSSVSKSNSEIKLSDKSAEKESVADVKATQEKEQKKRNGDIVFLLFSGLLATISLTALKLKVNSAKKVSRWAKNNRKKTWLAFVALRALTIPGALLSGMLLYANDVIVTPFATGVLATTFIASTLLYPSKNAQGRIPYLRHKMTDLVVALTGFMMLAGVGNTMIAAPESRPAKLYSSVAGLFTKDVEKTKAQFAYEQIMPKKNINDDNAGDIVLKIFLLILATALFVGLELLIGAISCNLSCSGQESAAAFVAIIGTALNILLFVFLIRAIFSKPKPVTTN